jgi:hypothetical protein
MAAKSAQKTVSKLDMGPSQIQEDYALCPGVYVLGCFASGLTVYSQQVRAHNLSRPPE